MHVYYIWAFLVNILVLFACYTGLMGFLADVMDVGSAMTANALFLTAVSIAFARFVKEPNRT